MESTAPASNSSHAALHQQLARTARRQFVEDWCTSLPQVDGAILDLLNELMQQPGTLREMQIRRSALLSYEAKRNDWLAHTARAWREGLLLQSAAMLPPKPATQPFPGSGLELLSEEVVENKLLASRLALMMLEHAGSVFTEVRRRTEYLQGHGLAEDDIVRSEMLCLRLIEQWLEVGLVRDDLLLVSEALRNALMELALEHYRALQELYDQHGIEAPAMLRVVRPAGAAATGLHSPDASSMTTLQRLQPAAEMDTHNPAAMLGTTLVQARERAQGIMVQLHRLIEVEQPSAANHHHGRAVHHAPVASAATVPTQPLAPNAVHLTSRSCLRG